ncbi:hypothetical protein B0I35DRAFT_86634 [Stachybotrys elegans]|uniref:Secreted protein n=1 Tax=Stachybotrys elegans TaxID=80388 RepID=A0A8K0SK91_9HYPO|nr:hypothetical protein B0I35DRAFT_86634 [Stachybotrys elegans]
MYLIFFFFFSFLQGSSEMRFYPCLQPHPVQAHPLYLSLPTHLIPLSPSFPPRSPSPPPPFFFFLRGDQPKQPWSWP